jgi:hypothetical protein
MKSPRPLLAAALVLAACARGPDAPPPVETRTVLSDVFTIDTLYASMQGPYRQIRVQLGDSTDRDLRWVVGYEASIVGEDGRTPMSAEYMCHSNLDFDMARHRQLFGWSKYPSRRVFTLSEGQSEVRLPDGFGIPVRADEPLFVTAQVLNHNHRGAPVRVRQRIVIHYIRDAALHRPLVPLYQKAAAALVRTDGPDGGYDDPEEHDHMMHGADGEAADTMPYHDDHGRTFAGHWVVKPGREVRHTPVSGWLGLPADQTLHFVSVHLHPFAESLELRDLTTGTTIFRSSAENHHERIGLSRVEQMASVKGIALHKDHQYDLVSTYDNTSGTDRTAMAVMYLYLEDTEFRRPR